MLITLGFLVMLVFAINPIAAVTHHPVGVVLLVGALVAFGISGACISKLGRPQIDSEPRGLWRKSLICHVGILVAAVVGFGFPVGLLLGLMEVTSVALHVAALAASPEAVHDV
jgi:hypothetical protein